jgi:hypothetical protein
MHIRREAPPIFERRRSAWGTRIAAIVAPDERAAGRIAEAFAATPIVSGFNEPIAWGEAVGSKLPSLRTPWR